ncbi:uncharacterized protein BYT42DRAFT_32709 [Radiomyces spectabilis]|uniref:uncharacterized protein n=1 Tax=Radiomyces spectabilis TaxID=64574 RepID=UPI00221F18B7|nr:uncharacterized protein BYT42DRAFT_32709 [Radiomyces spectabilis]KAI8394149.1 hypothetical protein BYT42DRAFT_32709 [Radiomyces spectabilis]
MWNHGHPGLHRIKNHHDRRFRSRNYWIRLNYLFKPNQGILTIDLSKAHFRKVQFAVKRANCLLKRMHWSVKVSLTTIKRMPKLLVDEKKKKDCGHICHSKCKSNSVCHQNIHGGTLDKSFFSKSTSDLPKSKMSSMMKTDMEGSTTRSLQRSSYHHDDADKANFPRPTSSVSSQLRQRTRKLSRVFTSVVHQPTSTTYPLNKNRSTETLQDIQESEVFLPPLSSGTRDERQRKTKRDKGKPSSPDECIIS